ncbi:hypothetical protein EON81_13930 [bacterium]|nr:MAG: hypothetical protein EON81_13930 [bacterium]
MRRAFPFLLLLAGCASTHPVAEKIDMALPDGARVTGGNEKDQGTQFRYELQYETDTKAAKLAEFYKAKGMDALVQGESMNAVGSSPKGQLLKIDAKDKAGTHQVTVVAIQPKDAPR